MSNPYALDHVWNDETLKAWKSMPLTSGGHVLSLFDQYPGRARDTMEARWREWARRTPHRLHPIWLRRWFEMHPAERAQAAA